MWKWNTRQDAAPKCEAFRRQGGTQVSAAADKSKLHGRSFDLEFELEHFHFENALKFTW
jgi:hypothetical protein